MFDSLKFWQSDDDLALDDDLPPLDDKTDDIVGDDPVEQEAQNRPSPDRSMDDSTPGSMPDSSTPEQQSGQELPGRTPGELKRDMSTPDVSMEKTHTEESAEPAQPQSGRDRELELINSKLDSLKKAVDSMDQRIRNIEQIAEEESGTSDDPWKNF